MSTASVTANGQPVPLPASAPLEEFLARLGFPPRTVVVEHNGEAVAPSEFKRRMVKAGDRLEIVKVVAGG